MVSSADSSPLSTPPDSEDEEVLEVSSDAGNLNNAPSPEEPDANSPKGKKRKFVITREPLLEDNPDIAFIVAFQARFNSLFRGVPNLGCQNVETGISETPISEDVELLICRLLGLLLNRKKYVEKGHYGRAMEEAITTYLKEGPDSWNGEHPLHGGHTFLEMPVEERLTLVRTLIIWSLRHSEAVQAILKDNYKLNRKENDSNVDVAVLPWGMDRDKRKYYLIEGKDDTTIRLFQEHVSPGANNSSWFSVAGTIEELQAFAITLQEDGSRNAKELKEKIINHIPRFEEGILKRQKREYRQRRKAQFSAYAVGPSIYEGRTRGKRIRYNYDSDDDGGYTDNNQSGMSTRGSRSRRDSPEPPSGPYMTASGRQSRRPGGLLSDAGLGTNGSGTPYTASESESTRPTRQSLLRNATAMDIDMVSDADSVSGEDAEEDDYDNKDATEDDDDDDEDDVADDDSLVSTSSTSPPELKVILKFKHPGDLRELALKMEKSDLSESKLVDSVDAEMIADRDDVERPITNGHTKADNIVGTVAKVEHDTHMVISGSDAHHVLGTPGASI